ncbi:unnamed protein product [Ceratitis capitata]|uniref:(Mediterranean fruit fly) hypothetical protein n=1 Tax=Ceratitis capitata TaxID=7213 RepID=A0A811V612_CERCA|nr:unnamed protein product [Ceratitis capitata]
MVFAKTFLSRDSLMDMPISNLSEGFTASQIVSSCASFTPEGTRYYRNTATPVIDLRQRRNISHDEACGDDSRGILNDSHFVPRCCRVHSDEWMCGSRKVRRLTGVLASGGGVDKVQLCDKLSEQMTNSQFTAWVVQNDRSLDRFGLLCCPDLVVVALIAS